MNDPSEEIAPATRGVAVMLLVFAALIIGGNALALRFMGRYFPLILAFAGPLVTMGIVGLISPKILDALFSTVEKGHTPTAIRVSWGAFLLGVVLSLVFLFKAYIG